MKVFEINFRYTKVNKIWHHKSLVITDSVEQAKLIFWNENKWAEKVDGMIYNINEREFINDHMSFGSFAA